MWAALGFFSVMESALNIVYGLPNRPFVHQKALVLALTAAALVVLFVALVVGSLGVEIARHAGFASGALAYLYGITISTALVFGFVWCIYTLLTNERLRWRETLPGAIFASVVLQASFQLLPLFVRGDERARRAPGLRRLRAPAPLDLPDGERDRPRRRGELVPRPRPADGRRGVAGARLARRLVARERRVVPAVDDPPGEGAEDLPLHVGHRVDHAPERLAREDEEAQLRSSR